MSLQTPERIRSLQRKLYLKAKAEPAFRFYLLYDKIYRADILSHAYALARSNGGAPGRDGITFETIEADGLEGWLAGLRDDLVAKTYKPQPVRRVMIPKPGVARGRSGSRPFGTGWFRPPPSWFWSRSSRRTSIPVPMAIVRDGAEPTQSRKCTGSCAGAIPTWSMPICRRTSTRSPTGSCCVRSPGGLWTGMCCG